MKWFRFASILLVCASILFVSCENGSVDREACPLPGGKAELLQATVENTGEKYTYTYEENIWIPSEYDGETIKIAANLYQPVAKYDGEKFPAIIFMNSWAMEEHEYVAQAQHFVRKGYIVLSYSHRGWGLSGGKASLSGPWDYADFSNVVDWLEENTPVDMENIGVSGISLGGGGSLNAISHDKRIKTACALSSYMDMVRSMWSEETPRMFWGLVLVSTGTLLARPDPNIYKIWYCTLTNTNIDWLVDTIGERSPVAFLDTLNSWNKPIYIGHNLEDYLFQPDVAIDYFNALTVDHKRMDLNQGTHATGEGPGLFGLHCYVYDNVDKWFDYWLKGIDTGIVPKQAKSAVVTMEEKNNLARSVYNTGDLTAANGTYIWPARSISTETFYCEPKGTVANGKLSSTSSKVKGINAIVSSYITGATAGAMLIPMLEQFKMPLTCDLSLLDRTKTIVYEGEALTSAKKLRGKCEATLRLSLSRNRGQVIMYLYDVNENGIGTFITHGFKTFWDAKPYYVKNVNIPLVATAYDVPAGHHLALVIDTADLMYAKPDAVPYVLSLHHGEYGQSSLTLSVDK